MPIHYCWHNEEKTIIRYEFHGAWGWNDFYPAYNAVVALRESVPHTVHIIADLRQSAPIPPQTLGNMRQIGRRPADNLGVVVLVTTHRLIQQLFAMGARMYPDIARSYATVATLEAAEAIIASRAAGGSSGSPPG